MSKKKIFKEFVVKGEKISKWVKKTREFQWDSNGNKIHFKDCDGHEWWAEYDSNGNLINDLNYNLLKKYHTNSPKTQFFLTKAKNVSSEQIREDF